MAVVTHKPEIKVEPAAFGARVKTSNSNDLVFRGSQGVRYEQEEDAFDGIAGLIRRGAVGRSTMSLLRGVSVRHSGVELRVSTSDVAVEGNFRDPAEITGTSIAYHRDTLSLTLPSPAMRCQGLRRWCGPAGVMDRQPGADRFAGGSAYLASDSYSAEAERSRHPPHSQPSGRHDRLHYPGCRSDRLPVGDEP